jgi:abortive infection bacteriophage resistance protein
MGIIRNRGVIIKNKKLAKRLIRQLNYYNLINGYKTPFIQTSTPYEKYLPGTTFEEIYALYEFDRKLRLLTLNQLLKIEKETKTLISYSFSKNYGHKDYLKIENFDKVGSKKYSQVCDLLSSLFKKISQNIEKDLSVTHYVSGKNYLPLWVLTNTMSFTDTSKFYSCMMQKDRDDVAKRLKWGLRENQLASALHFLSSIRNRCAHDERLYSYSSYANLATNNYFKYFRISKETNNYFAVLVALKLILSRNDYRTFHTQIEELLAELSTKLKVISVNKIRKEMGFPNNWKKLKDL